MTLGDPKVGTGGRADLESRTPGPGVVLGGVLLRLSRERRSGLLHLSGDGSELSVHLVHGAIASVSSRLPDGDFGQFLVRTGRLKSSDLELASRVMEETGQRAAPTLVELGHASQENMRVLLAEHAQAAISQALAWERCGHRFEEAEPEPDGLVAGLAPADLIMVAVRRIGDSAVAGRVLGRAGTRLTWPEAPASKDVLARLDAAEKTILDIVRGQPPAARRVPEITSVSTVEPAETLRSLYALVGLGVLELSFEAERTPQRPEDVGPLLAEQAPVPGTISAGSGGSGSANARIGRYVVVDEIGRGAMGAVYLAKDPTIDRVVAVKVIQAASGMSGEEQRTYTARFYQEARAAGKLLHPGIVTLFDVAHLEDGTPYIVMEHVRGMTLKARLETEPLGLAEAVRLGTEILEALGYAHERGVVHRDVKPANVLVTDEGKVKVMDFGVAHIVGSELTQAEEVIGTPSFMAPEQLSKDAVDRRTDLFAFGVMLYQMTTGRLPFTGDSIIAIAHAIVSEEPAPVHELNPSMPASLSAVVARCLRKKPAERFQSAGELRRALLSVETEVAAARSVPRSERRQPLPEARDAAVARSERISLSGLLQFAGRSGRLGAFAAAGFALTLLGLHFFRLTTPAADPADRAAIPDTGPPDPREVVVPSGSAAGTPVAIAPVPSEGADAGAPVLEPEADALKAENSTPSLPSERAGPPRSEEELPSAAAAPRPVGWAEPAGGGAPIGETPSARRLLELAVTQRDAGDLEASRATLEWLLNQTPADPEAAAMLAAVDDALWRARALPMVFEARHNHRLGSCTGRLSLEDWGVSFASADHERWAWRFAEIQQIEREDAAKLRIQTQEKEALRLGRSKRYVFDLLDGVLRTQEWERYRRLVR